jgi:hypothetical protein
MDPLAVMWWRPDVKAATPCNYRLLAEEEARWSDDRGEQIKRGQSLAMPYAAQLPWRVAEVVVQYRLVGHDDHCLHRPNGLMSPCTRAISGLI